MLAGLLVVVLLALLVAPADHEDGEDLPIEASPDDGPSDEASPRGGEPSASLSRPDQASDRDRPTLEDTDWEALPAAPIAGRQDALAVEATIGDAPSLWLWGGERDGDATLDGARLTPEAEGWEEISEPPLAPAQAREATGAWTGEAMVVLADAPGERTVGGAAWEPERGWREIAAAHEIATWQRVAWEGRRLVVLGFDRTGRPGVRAEAYDPDADRWRALPRPPVRDGQGSLGVTGLGEEVVVLGDSSGGLALTRLDATEPRWSEPEPWTGEGPRPRRLAVTGHDATGTVHLIGMQTGRDRLGAWTWQRQDGWRSLPRLPAEVTGPDVAAAVTRSGHLAVWDTGRHDVAVLDPEEDRWHARTAPVEAVREGAAATVVGDDLVVWGGEGAGPDGLRLPLTP